MPRTPRRCGPPPWLRHIRAARWRATPRPCLPACAGVFKAPLQAFEIIEKTLGVNQGKSLPHFVSSVVIPARNNHDGLIGYFIHQPVLIIDAARPIPPQLMPERLGFTKTCKWVTQSIHNQINNPLIQLFIYSCPLDKILESASLACWHAESTAGSKDHHIHVFHGHQRPCLSLGPGLSAWASPTGLATRSLALRRIARGRTRRRARVLLHALQ